MTRQPATTGEAQTVYGEVHEAVDVLVDGAREKLREVTPKLRGWQHLVVSPLVLVAGVVLVALSPTTTTRIGSAVFASTSLLLFTVSAIYHCGTWSRRTWEVLRRFDHANIFLLIAGSYTPFTLILLEGGDRVGLLCIAWGGAALGVLFRVLWIDAPRWLYVPIYVGLGWAAVFYAGAFTSGGSSVLILVATGGLLYTIGGVVYGLKRPNPALPWFGYHEVFHTFTVAAFTCHYIAASIATYALR